MDSQYLPFCIVYLLNPLSVIESHSQATHKTPSPSRQQVAIRFTRLSCKFQMIVSDRSGRQKSKSAPYAARGLVGV